MGQHDRTADRVVSEKGLRMAGRGPSRQELIRRRRSSTFIGRHDEVAAFRDALRQSPDEAPQFLFHVRGPAGVGKSTLVRQLETVAREGQAVTAYVDESVADVVETMEVISAQFAQQGVALKGFDKLLATYRQRRHEADAGMATAAAGADAAAGGSPAPSPSSVIASQLGLVGLGMLPGVGAFTGAVDPNQVAAGADRAKALLSTRLRSHGDVELVLSPLDALTPVFLEELGEVARKHPWIVLFFDTYERTGPMLRALALSPDYASALGGRGGTYGRLGRYEEALADLDRAVELRPEYGWALDRRGELYELLGRYEESLADYDRSVLLDPDDAWTLRGRGKTHQMLGRYEESLADFGRAVHLLPGNCAPLTARGVTYRVLGRYDEALADLVEAADLDCGNAWTHYETAVVLHALGHPDRDRHLARVLELTPNGAPAEGGSAADIGNLVLAHCVWPRWERAGQHLAEFLAKVPPPGQMHELLVALRSLIPVIPSAESRIEELCRAVEGRLDAPS
ncbi:tetratricopeptide repeat protein [Streptomyces sp. NPDC020817]|uniref:tetratricopeptide repeat protein n=1 Tax=Streptomyces sp. NPDC020817 TaxID=3365095 RepID=UPI00378D46C0